MVSGRCQEVDRLGEEVITCFQEGVIWCQEIVRKVPDCFWKVSDGVRKVSVIVRKVSDGVS